MTSQAELAAGRTGMAGRGVDTHGRQALTDLTAALRREVETVRSLRETLVRQRAGVAADSPDAVHASCDDIGRILVALDNAKRYRQALLAALVPGGEPTFEALDAALEGGLPPALDEARATLRAEAEETAREAAVNRTVLKRTVEAGEAFLQALFTGVAEPEAVYRAGERREDDGAGFLLDRKV
jgi:multidrug resistance efflux pump